jgi:hypothetical protein
MKIEDQVCSLEQAKTLFKLGVNLKTVFRYGEWMDKSYHNIFYSSRPKGNEFINGYTFFPAPTVAELGVLLPQYVNVQETSLFLCQDKREGIFIVWYPTLQTFSNKHEAQARAAALIWLIDNDKINPKTLKL